MSTSGNTFSCPTLVPGGNQSIRESGPPPLWIQVECAWATLKGACVSLLLPLKLHSSNPRLIPTRVAAPSWGCLRCLETALSARRLHSLGLSWGPQHQETWRFGYFSKVLKARGSGYHPLGALGTVVPARLNQTVEVTGHLIKGTLSGRFKSITVQPLKPWLPRFQGRNRGPSQVHTSCMKIEFSIFHVW